jgi:hypothetical protein
VDLTYEETEAASSAYLGGGEEGAVKIGLK